MNHEDRTDSYLLAAGPENQISSGGTTISDPSSPLLTIHLADVHYDIPCLCPICYGAGILEGLLYNGGVIRTCPNYEGKGYLKPWRPK